MLWQLYYLLIHKYVTNSVEQWMVSKLICQLCWMIADSQENLWNLWGSVIADWETLNKKKSSHIRVCNYILSV